MIKKIMLSSVLFSTFVFADVIPNVEKTIEPQIEASADQKNFEPNSNKIVISKDSIKIGNNEVRTKLIEFLKSDFLLKNPNVVLEIEDPSEINIEVDLGTCTSCHGYDLEIKAMGVSKILSKMSEDEIRTALSGYKNDTYGGTMKSVMKTQVMKYTNEELETIIKSIIKGRE